MNINRRALLATGAALAAAPLFPIPALAAADLGDAALLRERVAAFAKLLSPEESAAARFPFRRRGAAALEFHGRGRVYQAGSAA